MSALAVAEWNEWMGFGGWMRRTSPSSRRILKLLLLILSVGEPGKHDMQFVRV